MTIATSLRPTLSPAATTALAADGAALVALLTLHVTDPQLDPSWRMVSEYADGGASWLLSLFFVAWAIGSWATAAAARPWLSGRRARAGAVLVAISGVGEAMAAVFDLHHPLHGVAFAIGASALPVGALLLGPTIARAGGAPALARVSHLPWLSVLAMAAAFGVLMATAGAAGIDLSTGQTWTGIPAGVVAVTGWANRLLVLCYLGWSVTAALATRTAPPAAPR